MTAQTDAQADAQTDAQTGAGLAITIGLLVLWEVGTYLARRSAPAVVAGR